MSHFLNTLILLRIPFSVYLLPVYLFAISQTQNINIGNSIWVFFLLHLLIYPASNGYNSFMDEDTGPIGGLENPPPPSKQLFYTTVAIDLLALILGWLIISPVFAIGCLGYIFASRAYSYKGIRLKKYPIIGFLTVIIFQGAYTFILVAQGVSGDSFSEITAQSLWLPAIASSLIIGGGYPLTQIYQHKEDQENGDQTISILLGFRGTFVFTIISFILANGILAFYFYQNIFWHFMVFQLCSVPLLIWFFAWMYKTWNNTENASFKHLMRMNNLSALCMNTCYLILIFLNHPITL